MYHICVITRHYIFTNWNFKHKLVETSFNGLSKDCCSQLQCVSEENEITYNLYFFAE